MFVDCVTLGQLMYVSVEETVNNLCHTLCEVLQHEREKSWEASSYRNFHSEGEKIRAPTTMSLGGMKVGVGVLQLTLITPKIF